jgi:hypothetical protein
MLKLRGAATRQDSAFNFLFFYGTLGLSLNWAEVQKRNINQLDMHGNLVHVENPTGAWHKFGDFE